MSDLITIDGSAGEGGGQILRTSLGLALVTGRPFRIERIRARRNKPGLLRQHLTAVQAAAAIGRARVTGAELGSSAVTFEPTQVTGGDYHWAIGTAGSATLVLQAVLPALLGARESSRLTLEGGTHNPAAPPYDFLAKTVLPVLRRMGASIEIRLERPGFYPAGGGRVVVTVEPRPSLQPVTLLERGRTTVHARALVASLPEAIAKRELSVVRDRLGLDRALTHVEAVDASIGPGNVVMITIASESVVEVITGFGRKGVSAEQVAAEACDEAQQYLAVDVPVGTNLADQLLVPLALAGGGTFRTLRPTPHTISNADVIQRFVDLLVVMEDEGTGAWTVRLGRPGPPSTIQVG